MVFLEFIFWVIMLEQAISLSSEIHHKLKELIDLKSRRDGKEFTITQLAKAIEMPHSMLVKLVHADPNKRVVNPRIDTIKKIVEFFKSDGFSITIDDFIFGKNEIDINSISLNQETEKYSLEVFSLNDIHKKIGNVDINVPVKSNGLLAFITDAEIKPFFKSGSMFIVDTKMKTENEHLVAVRLDNNSDIEIMKLNEKNNTRYLSSLTGAKDIIFSPVLHHIIGVIVQVNAIT